MSPAVPVAAMAAPERTFRRLKTDAAGRAAGSHMRGALTRRSARAHWAMTAITSSAAARIVLPLTLVRSQLSWRSWRLPRA
eukprot:scaffold36132_cov34-Tisochrysis_lutea.AAC.3